MVTRTGIEFYTDGNLSSILGLQSQNFSTSDCPLSDILLEKLGYVIILTRKLCLQPVMYIADADTVTLPSSTVYYKEYLITTPFLASTYR